jgi:hypothetical protein
MHCANGAGDLQKDRTCGHAHAKRPGIDAGPRCFKN